MVDSDVEVVEDSYKVLRMLEKKMTSILGPPKHWLKVNRERLHENIVN